MGKYLSLNSRMLKITFLGTGTSQGIPVIGSSHPVCLSDDPRDKRLRVSVLIQWDNQHCVIDCGPDFRQQLLRTPIPRLDALLFTHEHADHTAGLDDVRPFFFKQGKLDVYMDQRVEQSLKTRFGYIFQEEDRYPGAPELRLHRVEKDRDFSLGGKQITPIQVHHNTLPIFGYRIDNFAYLTDVKSLPEDQIPKLKGLDVLVINALREEPHPSHLHKAAALEWVDILQPKRTYFTHISHLMGFHQSVESQLPQNVFLAYDTLEIHSN